MTNIKQLYFVNMMKLPCLKYACLIIEVCKVMMISYRLFQNHAGDCIHTQSSSFSKISKKSKNYLHL